IEPSFATRLARLLDRQTWVHEGGCLICRLTHPTAEQRRGMTREPLIDRPEVEVRFVADADGEPVLAEVAFPESTLITAAKSFLFHQRAEVLLRPCGEVEWHQTADAIVASWPAIDRAPNTIGATGSPDGTWIELEPGVREKVIGTGCAAFTAAVSFD